MESKQKKYGEVIDSIFDTMHKKCQAPTTNSHGIVNFDLVSDLKELNELLKQAPPEISSLIFAMCDQFRIKPMAVFVTPQDLYATTLGTYQFQNCVMTNFAKELMGTLKTLNAKFFVVDDVTR